MRINLTRVAVATALVATFSVGLVTNVPVVRADCGQWTHNCKGAPSLNAPVNPTAPSAGDESVDGIGVWIRTLLTAVFG